MQSRPEDPQALEQCQMVAVPNLVAAKDCFTVKRGDRLRASCLALLLFCSPWTADSVAAEEPPGRELSEQQLQDLKQDMQRLHGAIDSLVVPFKQHRRLAVFSHELVADGFIAFQAPSSLRFELISPFASALLYDGRTVQNYEHVKGKWQKLNSGADRAIASVMRHILNWLRGDFGDGDGMFSVTAYNEPEGAVRFRLTPIDRRLKKVISAIDIQVGPPPRREVLSVRISQPGGDQTEMVFGRKTVNPTLPPGSFTEVDRSRAIRGHLFEARE